MRDLLQKARIIAGKWLIGDGGEVMLELVAEVERLQARVAELEAKAKELRKEIEVLRLYGNKDCTAMADERLAEIKKERGDE